MNKNAFGRMWRRMAVAIAAIGLATGAHADDIDIFMANTAGGSLVNPNIMIFVDNSANWSRAAQQWPDNGNVQGAAEMQAIANVVSTGISAGGIPANIGLAGFTGSGNTVGAYIRFGIRDMTVASNKAALVNIANYMRDNTNSPSEKVNDSNETAAMYEVYKYFKSMPVFRGAYVSGNDPANNVDIANNPSNPTSANPKKTAAAFGLTGGFAYDRSNNTYLNPQGTADCGKNYLIMVINNAQGSLPTGQQIYEQTNAGAYLSPPAGVNDTTWTATWARFLYQNGISVYILDAYNAQQNVAYSRSLEAATKVAGGGYYAVKNQADIELAFKKILAEINAANSTFASASLPISATNRSQDLNQVFIGMFRPDQQAEPRWRGNLKRYKLKRSSNGVDLVDAVAANAVNTQTGFVNECAISFFTTDSGSYWQSTKDNNISASTCSAFPVFGGATGSKWSDMPDGATVDKGGVAEVIRKGNNPPSTNTTPTWNAAGRNIVTYSSSTTNKLTALTATVAGWPSSSTSLLDWFKGMDDTTSLVVDNVTTYPYSEFTDTTATSARTRPSIHGDVVHSRPLPVNYSADGVTVFYGANDGTLRAVDAETGKERWAYVGPEHFSKIQRLHDNTPLVSYPNVSPTLNPKPKDYFFDGSISLYQTADNDKIWIFPTQRRGGRMLYGFDVTDPSAPRLKWRVGCPNATDDNNCTSDDFKPMGQTWSVPAVAFLKGETTTDPVLVVGAGYDTCEDANVSAPGCTTRKGAGVFVLNAATGDKIAFFPTSGSVAADVVLSDANNDGSVDFGYAVTTTGEVYRIDFSNASFVPQGHSAWRMRKVAVASGSRKFLFQPALLRAGTKMYLALGSGDREHPLSTHYPVTGPVTNRFYVFLDDLSVAASATDATPVNLDTDLLNYSSATAATCNISGVTPNSGLKGWYMDLLRRDENNNPLVGEQTISSALIAAGMVTFNTNRAITNQSNVCVNPLGEARGYWVNLLNGSGAIGVGDAICGGERSVAFVGGGLTPSPTLATVVIDGQTTTVAIGAAQRTGGASSSIAPQQVKPGINSRRRSVYWKSNAAD